MELPTSSCPCYARVSYLLCLKGNCYRVGEANRMDRGKYNYQPGDSMLHVMIRDLNLFHGDHCNMERAETEYEEAATNHVDKPEKGH
jgi:hypothetical protein